MQLADKSGNNSHREHQAQSSRSAVVKVPMKKIKSSSQLHAKRGLKIKVAAGDHQPATRNKTSRQASSNQATAPEGKNTNTSSSQVNRLNQASGSNNISVNIATGGLPQSSHTRNTSRTNSISKEGSTKKI